MVRVACLVLSAVILAACAPQVEQRTPNYQSASKQCATIGALGAVIMAARQTGRSRAETLQSLNDGEDSQLTQLARVLVKNAYSIPIRGTKRAKEDGVRRFTAVTTTACQRARREALSR